LADVVPWSRKRKSRPAHRRPATNLPGIRRFFFIAVGIVALGGAAIAFAHSRLEPRGYSRASGAQVVHYNLKSRLLRRNLQEIGVVPSGGGNGRLLVLLHGRHDPGPLHWLGGNSSGPQSMLSDAFFAGLARLGDRAPTVVLLNGSGHSYYHDRRDGPWATSILDEAIPDAIRRFHTHGTLAIGGISMGGYGALHLASLRPNEFCAVGGHSTAVWTSGGVSAPGAFDDAEDYARNDIFAAARKLNGIPVWLDNGDRDPFLAADAQLARTLHIKQHVWPGGHTRSYWDAHMAQYLRFYADACD
jgi:S-formylglutathione hydrolase FrmB